MTATATALSMNNVTTVTTMTVAAASSPAVPAARVPGFDPAAARTIPRSEGIARGRHANRSDDEHRGKESRPRGVRKN